MIKDLEDGKSILDCPDGPKEIKSFLSFAEIIPVLPANSAVVESCLRISMYVST